MTINMSSTASIYFVGDTTVPGLGVSSNNIIPLITNLQASLKANVPREDPRSNLSSFQENIQATDRLSSQVHNNTSNLSNVSSQVGESVQTLGPSSVIEVPP